MSNKLFQVTQLVTLKSSRLMVILGKIRSLFYNDLS